MSSFYEWVASGFGHDVAEGRQRELDEQERQRADLERRQETYVGTTTPMRDRQSGSELDPTTGRPFERVVGGTEQHDASGWSWLSESWRWITGETTTTQGVNDETGRATLATSEQRTTAAVRPDGTASYQHVDGTRTEVLDVAGLAGDARGQLAERKTAHTERLAEATAELASLDREREAAPPDQRAELDRRRDEVERRRQRLEGELVGLTRDLATLERTDLDEQALNGVLRSNGILLAPRYKTDVEHRETTSATLARSGVGATGALSTSTRDVQGGVTTTSTDTVRAGADLYSGTASASASSTVTEQQGGTTDSATMSTSGRVSASGGRVTASRSDEVSMSSTDKDGNVTLGGSASRQRSGGIIASADELGVAAGRTDATSTTVDGVTRGRSDESSAQITDHGVRASASTDRTVGSSRTADGVTATWGGGAKTSRDGAFTVDVQPVAGTSPARYEVTMTLSAGAGVTLSGSAGRSREGEGGAGASARSASGSVGATGSIEMTYRHQMSEAEAQAYMLEADQAEAGAATRAPEFGLVSRLRAILAEGDQAAAGGLAVLGSSAAAAEMGAGESIELSLTGGISGELAGSASGGGFGGGVEAGGSLSATRRIKVERASDGEHQVDVTVTFADASSSRLGGSATAFGATAGYRHSEAASQSEAATVRLDTSRPDYAEKYATVCAALSIDEVRALATRFTAASSTTSGDRTTMGGAGVSLTIGSESTQSEEITRDLGEHRVSGTVSGGQTDSASLGTGATVSERNTATTTVDGAGIDVRLEREEASTSPVRALEEGWQSLVTWWSGEHDAADVARTVATSPQERLKKQLETSYSRLHEHSLGEADLDLLRGRAADTDNWTNCARSYRVYEAWRQLGRQLVSPHLDPELAAINAQDATRLALATSLAQFMAANGHHGMNAMNFCLMRWGERGMTISDADDVGVMREWPSGIVGKRGTFMTARDRVRGADEHLTPLARAADGRTRAEAWRDDTLQRLRTVEDAVVGCHDFEHPRAKVEMLDEIARLRQELAAAMARHLPVLEAAADAGLGTDDGALMSREPAGAELTSQQPVLMSTPETAETAPADRERMADLLRILGHFKAEETAVFMRCHSMMRRELGGTIDGTWDYIRHGDENVAVKMVTEVGELHEAWIPRIVELRAVYRRLGIAEEQWVVSSGPGQARRPGTEPDVRTLVDIYMISDGSLALSDTGVRRGIARQWEARVRAY